MDNWEPLSASQNHGFTHEQAALTITFLEIGGLIGSATWGWVSDRIGGRRAVIGILCLALDIIPMTVYATTSRDPRSRSYIAIAAQIAMLTIAAVYDERRRRVRRQLDMSIESS